MSKYLHRENLHREKKRKIEMSLIVSYLKDYFKGENQNILEFGCGDGFQIPFLEKISNNVTAIDIEVDAGLKNRYLNTEVYQSSINHTPFNDNQFQLIFSNHVIEHLEDLHGATREMIRIGSNECVYVFSVPTNIWLLLSLPAQYYRKIKYIFGLSNKRDSNNFDMENNKNSTTESQSLLQKMIPKGHGVYTEFFECYNSFRIQSWSKLFNELGFNVIGTKPLLLYSASEFPVFPTTNMFTRFGICSSVLFILKKH